MAFLVHNSLINGCLQLIPIQPQIYLVRVGELHAPNSQPMSSTQPIILASEQFPQKTYNSNFMLTQLQTVAHPQSAAHSYQTPQTAQNIQPVCLPNVNNAHNNSANTIETNYTKKKISLNNIETQKRFGCTFCDKTYKRESNLRSHIQVHTKGGYACKHCQNIFQNKQQLRQHIRTHNNIKPYKCSFCTKSFKQTHTLKDHERIHRGERPFICDFCHKGFAAKCNLITHRRTHTGEKPYECKQCNKQYASKSGYNSHKKRHHK